MHGPSQHRLHHPTRCAVTARPAIVAVAAIAWLAALGLLVPQAAFAQCTSGTLSVVAVNSCRTPVWIGQHAAAGNGSSFPPLSGNWALAPSCQSDTDCTGAGGTGTCSSGQCTCTTDSDCPGGATCTGSLCATSATMCIPESWESGTIWGRTGCTLQNGDLFCETGQCGNAMNPLLDCGYGDNGGSAGPPVTLFEATTSLDGATQTANYDMSLVSGYNLEVAAAPIGGAKNGASCQSLNCANELNKTCPAGLRDTVAPAMTGSIPCGSGYCNAGVCGQDASGTTACVVGCKDPCTACSDPSPDPSLQCDTAIGSLMATRCDGVTMDPVTFESLYCAKNTADAGSPTMASPNQGTATCFGDIDCLPSETCVTGGFNYGFTPPGGSGVCIDPTDPTSVDYQFTPPGGGGTTSCSAEGQGADCGGYYTGYSNALGYTCQPVDYSIGGNNGTANVCLPPISTGVGTCTNLTSNSNGSTTQFYDAGAGVFNQTWLDAALVAGGGTTPFYEIFRDACPFAYAWQYDDWASGFGCSEAMADPLTGFDLEFCATSLHLDGFESGDVQRWTSSKP